METRHSPSITELRSLAEAAGIDKDSICSLSKQDLHELLKRNHNLERLKRWRKRSLRGSAVEKATVVGATHAELNHGGKVVHTGKRLRKDSHARLDPILLEPLGSHTFKFVRPNGTGVTYNVESLVDYLLKTGDFREPESRVAFTDADLKALDRLACEAKLGKPSVFQAKKELKHYSEMRWRRDALLGLERCAGEVVTQVLQVVEQCSAEEGQLKLCMSLFPQLAKLLHEMETEDKEYARQSIAHFKLFISGPPNRRTRDRNGLLPIVLTFFDDLKSGTGAW